MIEIKRTGRVARLLVVLVAWPISAPATDDLAATASEIEEIVVTSQRRDQPLLQHAGNVTLVSADDIQNVGHQHIHELMTRLAGAWLSRGSGQEHLTAIRSPVLSGAGSCGSFLFLEDGIPIRPSGFCNVNQVFELNTEQAAGIEVIRGPGSALYGSNALHGIVNVLTPDDRQRSDTTLAVEAGAHDFLRLRGDLQGLFERRLQAAVLYADDGGFRDDSGYRQAKLRLKGHWASGKANAFSTVFTATDLRQETAGYIVGQDAYKDSALNRGNLNPEAFRNASSQRLYGIWRRSLTNFDIDVRPYLRHSDMRFLQHFLPGQPLEENGHVSAGAMTALAFDIDNKRFIAGIDVEWSDMFLQETQFDPTQGSAFLVETRPVGKHYDYEVSSIAIAPYLQADITVSERLTLSAGLRLEQIRYDYDNRMQAGNLRDDGTPCGFGGCLYTRPASRSDHFFNVAPKLAFSYQSQTGTALFGSLARGFRAPQATELYRLQSGQQVADLDSETLDSVELGLRRATDRWSGEVSIFAMRKRNSVLRDAEGYNSSNGKSRHRGAEVQLDWQLHELLQLEVAASVARHVYDFDAIAARGEAFIAGNDVDTAPRWLGSAELIFEPRDDMALALQWTSTGEYFLDAENRFTYPGHDLLNLRARFAVSPRLSVTARLNNLLDTAYADRADYAFGQYRYFPGRGRELFVELRFSPIVAAAELANAQ